jgi:hypothetical protein
VKIPTRYGFDVLITAPEKITTLLVVDGAATPIRFVETAWQNPKGKAIITPDSSRI